MKGEEKINYVILSRKRRLKSAEFGIKLCGFLTIFLWSKAFRLALGQASVKGSWKGLTVFCHLYGKISDVRL